MEKKCVNLYTIDIDCASTHDKCFSTLHDDSWLWHRRLGVLANCLIKAIKLFLIKSCVIKSACDGKVLFIGKRCVNVYTIDIDCV